MNATILGADTGVTNQTGNNYGATLQATAARSRLYQVTCSPLAGMDADLYLWVFNTASGSAASAAPVAVRPLAQGKGDTWEFGADGALFTAGIYFALGTAAPTDATTTVTSAGNNKCIIQAEVRVA